MNNSSVKINKALKSFHDFFNINPHKHWKALLYISFYLVVLLIIFSLYLLYQIKVDKIFQVKIDKQENQTLLNEDLLKKTRDLYERKAKAEENTKNNPSLYKDPSI